MREPGHEFIVITRDPVRLPSDEDVKSVNPQNPVDRWPDLNPGVRYTAYYNLLEEGYIWLLLEIPGLYLNLLTIHQWDEVYNYIHTVFGKSGFPIPQDIRDLIDFIKQLIGIDRINKYSCGVSKISRK